MMNLSIDSEGGVIGPLWWVNRSPEFFVDIAGCLHFFSIKGRCGIGPERALKYRGEDIELHSVIAPGTIEGNLVEIDILLANLSRLDLIIIKSTLAHHLNESSRQVAAELKIEHLDRCFNQESAVITQGASTDDR